MCRNQNKESRTMKKQRHMFTKKSIEMHKEFQQRYKKCKIVTKRNHRDQQYNKCTEKFIEEVQQQTRLRGRKDQ